MLDLDCRPSRSRTPPTFRPWADGGDAVSAPAPGDKATGVVDEPGCLDADGVRVHRFVGYEVWVVDADAKPLWGRTLFVDSKFDEPVASGPYEVITAPLAP